MPDTICPIMVAAAAPTTPILNFIMKRASRTTFITAPIIIHFMVYLGFPSALIMAVNETQNIIKGSPASIILE